MPRPGSTVIHPGLYDSLRGSDYYPHEVTIKRATTSRTSTGASVSGVPALYLNAIPARVVPLGAVGLRKPSTGEIRRKDGTLSESPVEAQLAGRYEEIKVTDVAEWDGKTWNILNVFSAPADGRTVLQMEVVK